MRKLLITIATAASALAVAAPASAQYYPQQRSYNNGYGYNYGYGRQDLASFNANRLAQLRGQIRQYAMQGIISRGAAQRLEQQALQLNQQLRYTSRNGMSGEEGAIFDRRFDRLYAQVRAQAGVRNGYSNRNYGGNQYYGNNSYAYDRDRDHRDDRYEDDRGYDRDD